jgi:small subunit ribosomal protein S4
MARFIDSVCKLCRREGRKLFLKGARCESDKCSLKKRNYAPGMHGQRRGKLSEYGTRLREKQKLKRFYGLMQRQFDRYFEIASRSKENTGEVLMSLMERRLDNVIYRLGWSHSRAGARQLVNHGHIFLNGVRTDISSILLRAGDTVTVRNHETSLKSVRNSLADNDRRAVPAFLERTNNESEPPTGKITRNPSRSDVDPNLEGITEQLIIELCSR